MTIAGGRQIQVWESEESIMRLPNGYGSVFRLSNHRHRRKPFCVRITTGYDKKKHPKYSVVGYYSTREEGLNALAKWHKDPTVLTSVTFGEAAEKTFTRERNHLAPSTLVVYQNAYKHYLSCIANKKVCDLNLKTIQSIIDDIERISMQAAVKTAYRLIEQYCLKFDLMNKGFADLIEVKKYDKKSVRVPFSHQEIKYIWTEEEEEINMAALILLYTGMRIEELRSLKKSQVNLETRFIIAGSKTEAGKNRMIPIHPKIVHIFERLFTGKDDKDILLPMTNFRKDWERLCIKIGYRHVPHECRHTLISELDRCGANRVCIDRIVGHASLGVGERVYTHKTIDDLAETILKVTY